VREFPRAVVPLLLLLVQGGCAGVRAVRTLEPGATELALNGGGPFVVDYASSYTGPGGVLNAHLRHGLKDGVDAYLGMDLGAPAFGTVWVDGGVALRLLQEGVAAGLPYLLLQQGLHYATDLDGHVVLDELVLTMSYRFGAFMPFFGWDHVVSLAPALDHLGIAFVGLRWDGRAFFLSHELRWFGPWEDGGRPMMRYLSPGGAGVLGATLSIGVRL